MEEENTEIRERLLIKLNGDVVSEVVRLKYLGSVLYKNVSFKGDII